MEGKSKKRKNRMRGIGKLGVETGRRAGGTILRGGLVFDKGEIRIARGG
jgi:hypothetical protein